ncbi:MAG: tyrosine-type recombinase/integrase [Pseudomonadota bacterium]
MAPLPLTQSSVDKMHCPADRRKVNVPDAQVIGLMLELRATGGRTFYVRYTDKDGHRFQLKLGDAGVLKLSQARQLALEAKSRTLMGDNPAEAKHQAREVPTLASFYKERYLPYVKLHKRSWSTDESQLRCHIMPMLGKKRLDRITKADVIAVIHHHRATHKPASSNRLLVMLRFLYNLAIEWEIAGVTRNPTKGIPTFQENNRRERYLTPPEARRLFEALHTSPNSLLTPIVALLLLTGARRGEVLKARWEEINWAQRRWRIPLPKSGEARHVPLSDEALQLLAKRREVTDSEWVFANPKTGEPFQTIYNSWDAARKRAGLPDLRLHDLRHSFASFLINAGHSLYEVQKLLGHRQVTTTQRYAHLSDATLLHASNQVGTLIGPLTASAPRPAPVLIAKPSA